MPNIFYDAPEVERIAAGLIPKFHDHLIDETILYVFKEKHAKRNGKIVLATASLASGRQAFFALSEDLQRRELERQGQVRCFVIEVAADTWVKLTEEQKTALVDHELCHCWAEDVEKEEDGPIVRELSIRAHDVEEFGVILERHGLWKSDVEGFARVCHKQVEQLKLFEEPTKPKAGKAA